jgi:hypothetical protein
MVVHVDQTALCSESGRLRRKRTTGKDCACPKDGELGQKLLSG